MFDENTLKAEDVFAMNAYVFKEGRETANTDEGRRSAAAGT
jgi:hypothetical protein